MAVTVICDKRHGGTPFPEVTMVTVES